MPCSSRTLQGLLQTHHNTSPKGQWDVSRYCWYTRGECQPIHSTALSSEDHPKCSHNSPCNFKERFSKDSMYFVSYWSQRDFEIWFKVVSDLVLAYREAIKHLLCSLWYITVYVAKNICGKKQSSLGMPCSPYPTPAYNVSSVQPKAYVICRLQHSTYFQICRHFHQHQCWDCD